MGQVIGQSIDLDKRNRLVQKLSQNSNWDKSYGHLKIGILKSYIDTGFWPISRKLIDYTLYNAYQSTALLITRRLIPHLWHFEDFLKNRFLSILIRKFEIDLKKFFSKNWIIVLKNRYFYYNLASKYCI